MPKVDEIQLEAFGFDEKEKVKVEAIEAIV